MSTFRPSILANAWSDPAQTTDPAFVEPLSMVATNARWPEPIWRFGSNNAAQPTVRLGLMGSFFVPKNYASGAVLVVTWTATLTTGNVVWDFEYRSVVEGSTETVDQTGQAESLTVTDAAPSTALAPQEVTIALTDGNFAIDDLVQFFLARDGVVAGDTMAGSVILLGAQFEYSD